MANEKRLIDANVVLAKQFTAGLSDASGNYYGHADVVFVNDIENAPTVDAVEVKHGRWREKILVGGFAEEWGYVCSECGCTVSDRSNLGIGRYASKNQRLNYCPNCGAKMDGDGNG